MKKPVRKTDDEIKEIAAKRSTKNIREYKAIPSGDMQRFLTVLYEFAEKQGVNVEDVRFSRTWDGVRLLVVRPETDAEKFRRVRNAEDSKYRQAKWRYESWVRDEKYRKQQEADQIRRAELLVAAKSNKTECCPTNCCCRR